MIDWLLANPGTSYGVLAEELGVSRSWLSIVMHSDVFVEEYTRRRMEHNKELSRQLVEKQFKIALKAYDRLDVILEDDEVEDRIVLDAAGQTAKALGFSPSGGNAPKVSVDESIERETEREVAPGVLEKAREKLRRVTTMEGPIDALPSPEG